VAAATLVTPVAPQLRDTSWTAAPHVSVLPERLVLLGFAGDELVLDQLGAPIPAVLPVGPDPQAQPEPGVDSGSALLGDDLQWMVDFDRAVAIGMGFRAVLAADQFRSGFDQLFVLGVQTGPARSWGSLNSRICSGITTPPGRA
jgi:hypothetical protein